MERDYEEDSEELGLIPGDGTNVDLADSPPYAPGTTETLTHIPAQGGVIPVTLEIAKPHN